MHNSSQNVAQSHWPKYAMLVSWRVSTLFPGLGCQKIQYTEEPLFIASSVLIVIPSVYILIVIIVIIIIIIKLIIIMMMMMMMMMTEDRGGSFARYDTVRPVAGDLEM